MLRVRSGFAAFASRTARRAGASWRGGFSPSAPAHKKTRLRGQAGRRGRLWSCALQAPSSYFNAARSCDTRKILPLDHLLSKRHRPAWRRAIHDGPSDPPRSCLTVGLIAGMALPHGVPRGTSPADLGPAATKLRIHKTGARSTLAPKPVRGVFPRRAFGPVDSNYYRHTSGQVNDLRWKICRKWA